MKVCLIKPPILHKAASFALLPTAPLGLAFLAGSLKKHGHVIQVIDASAEGAGDVHEFRDGIHVFGLDAKAIVALMDKSTEVVCFSFMFTNNWMYDREVVKAVRTAFPKAVLVAGGEHITAAPEFSLTQAPGLDYAVRGEGEETLIELLDTLASDADLESVAGIVLRKDGKTVRTTARKRVASVEDVPWPAWEFFPTGKYFENRMSHGVYRGRTLPVMASRGCPYDCTFCSSPQMWGRKYQIRPPEDFVDELEHLHKTYGVVNFDLYDLTAIIYRDWTISMCKEILARGLDISFQLPSGTRAEAIDLEVAEHLFKAGCKNITYAPESGSVRMLRKVKKKVNTDKMLESIRASAHAGLNIHLNMIIGFPDETHSDIWRTLGFLLRCSWNGANDVAIAVFTPYPGSELFDRLSAEGKIDLYDDESLLGIIDSYDLWPSTVYSDRISPLFIKFYVFLLLTTFYGSNYLIRPWRLLRTLRNIITKKHESRLEQILYKNFFSNALGIKGSGIKVRSSASG